MMKFFFALLLVSMTLFIGCSPTKQTSALYSDSYDKDKDRTSIMIFPDGQVSIPGKWTKTEYNHVSDQYFFTNSDSMTFAVALHPWTGYEFYKKEMTKSEFVKAFYVWDSDYLRKEKNAEPRIVKEDSEKNFIIWNLNNSYFLFGLKDKTAFNLLVVTPKWDEKKKVELLEQIYSE